jgi:hypothetical protein
MNIHFAGKAVFAVAILLTVGPVAFAQPAPATDAPGREPISIPATKPGGKELYIPARISRVPATNASTIPTVNSALVAAKFPITSPCSGRRNTAKTP